MNRIMCFAFILLSCYSCTDSKERCTTIGVVDKVMWSHKRYNETTKKVYFSFVNNNQSYICKQEFSPIMNINIGDSVLIQYYCKNPKKAAFVRLIRRQGSEQREKEKKIITCGEAKKRDTVSSCTCAKVKKENE